jgi:hypothetical protein
MVNKVLCFLFGLSLIFLANCEKQENLSPDNNNDNQDLGFKVTVYDEDKACLGTTFFVYKYVDPDIIYEVDMNGNVVWELKLSGGLGNRQTEAELLPDDNILLVSQGVGLYKLDRDGNILWEHNDPKNSHDADQLSNGNILYVYGMGDMKLDTTVKEIKPDGTLVWSWRVFDYFNYSPFSEIDPKQGQGWAHTNAVTRLDNGNTLISIRNFNMIVEVNTQGVPVDTVLNIVLSPHDPEVIDDTYLLAVHQHPSVHSALKLNRNTKEVIWQFDVTNRAEMPMRDVNLLPNGNILITTALRLIEVVPADMEIVWQLELTDLIEIGDTPSKGFYKAERIPRSSGLKANVL